MKPTPNNISLHFVSFISTMELKKSNCSPGISPDDVSTNPFGEFSKQVGITPVEEGSTSSSSPLWIAWPVPEDPSPRHKEQKPMACLK